MVKVKTGDVLVMQRGNTYHEWLIRDIARRRGYPIKMVKEDIKEVKPYRYGTLTAGREIVWIKIDKKPAILAEIEKMNVTKRIVVLEVSGKEIRTRIKKFPAKKFRVINMPFIKTYEDKRGTLERIVSRWKPEFESSEVENGLIRLMIQNEETWDDVRLSIEIANRQGKVITKKSLEEMFPEAEFYKLDDWIDKLLKGQLKQKSLKMAEYFINVKGYSVAWLMNKIREQANEISLVYQAYKRGILYVPSSQSKIQERLDVVNWSQGTALLELSKRDQGRYLEFVQSVDYRYFVRVLAVLYSADEFVKSAGDLYRVLEEIRLVRSEFE